MQKILLILLVLIIVLTSSSVFAHEQVNLTEELNNSLYDFINSIIESEEAEFYGFEKDNMQISIGLFHPIYFLSTDFLQGKANELRNELVFASEWYAVVYQSGVPRGTVQLYTDRDGITKIAGYGNTQKLADLLSEYSSSEIVISIPPLDEYYLFSINNNNFISVVDKKNYKPSSFQVEMRNKYQEYLASANENGEPGSIGGIDNSITNNRVAKYSKILALTAVTLLLSAVLILKKRSGSTSST